MVKNEAQFSLKDKKVQMLLILFFSFFTVTLVLLIIHERNKQVKPKSLKGKVSQIKDGDTFFINGTKVRLYGIDAPELNQKCKFNNFHSKRRQNYPCGLNAKKRLRKLAFKRKIDCKIKKKKKKKKEILGVCYTKKYNIRTRKYSSLEINKYLVRTGFAVAYTKHSRSYIKDEKFARKNKLGIWKGNFIKPVTFRRRYRD